MSTSAVNRAGGDVLGRAAHPDSAVQADRLRAFVDSGALLLDLRSAEEFSLRRLASAVNIPWVDVQLGGSRQPELPPRSRLLAILLCPGVDSPAYDVQAAVFNADFKGHPWNVWGFFVPTAQLFTEAAPRAGIEVQSGPTHPRERGRLWEPSDMVERWLPRLEQRMGVSWEATRFFGAQHRGESLPGPRHSTAGSTEGGAAAAGASRSVASAPRESGLTGVSGGDDTAGCHLTAPSIASAAAGAAEDCVDATADEDYSASGYVREQPRHPGDSDALRPLCVDFGCGGGRDAVWAALRGWRVLALDNCAKRLARCAALAATHGVGDRVTPHLVDLLRTSPAEVIALAGEIREAGRTDNTGTEDADACMQARPRPVVAGPIRAAIAVRFLHRELAEALPALLPPHSAVLWFHFMRGAELTKVGRPNTAKDLLESNELNQLFSAERTEWTVLADNITHLPDDRPLSEFVAVRSI